MLAADDKNTLQLRPMGETHDAGIDWTPLENHSSTEPVPATDEIGESRERSKEVEQGQTASKHTEDESTHLDGLPLALLVFCLCLITFVVALDNTIIGSPQCCLNRR